MKGKSTIEQINQQADFFFNIGFSSTQNTISEAYTNQGEKYDEKLSAIAEEIIGNSINYFKGLLEDPNIWVSDMLGFEMPGEEEQDGPDIENHLNSNIFTEEKVFAILS